MIVKAVSKQLESVRVEQNHCHGLAMVRNSYKAGEDSISVGSEHVRCTSSPLFAMSATYSDPSLVASSPIHAFSQFPCVVIAKGRNDGLCDFGRSKKQFGMIFESELQQS